MGRVRAYWWNFLALVHAPSFDEAVFQVYLTLGQEALSSFEPTMPSSGSLLRALKGAVASFSASTKLTTGLSMERIWKKFRPQVPADYGRLQVLLRLEGLADRFDEDTWKFKASLSELCRIRNALSDAINLVLTEGVDAEGLLNVSAKEPYIRNSADARNRLSMRQSTTSAMAHKRMQH